VVIEHSTGVSYHQQFGGTACRQEAVEGVLVPVNPGALTELRAVFEGELRSTGVWRRNFEWPAGLFDRIEEAVESIVYWPTNEGEPEKLKLDRTRELDEAWIPVTTSDGNGVLLWANSD